MRFTLWLGSWPQRTTLHGDDIAWDVVINFDLLLDVLFCVRGDDPVMPFTGTRCAQYATTTLALLRHSRDLPYLVMDHMGSPTPQRFKTKTGRAVLGIEPRTSRTQSENHATRPNSQLNFISKFIAITPRSPSPAPPPLTPRMPYMAHGDPNNLDVYVILHHTRTCRPKRSFGTAHILSQHYSARCGRNFLDRHITQQNLEVEFRENQLDMELKASIAQWQSVSAH